MRTDITWLDVRTGAAASIAYCLGMAVYALVVVAMYPAFKTSNSLDKLIASDSTAAALFGISGPISTSVLSDAHDTQVEQAISLSAASPQVPQLAFQVNERHSRPLDRFSGTVSGRWPA